MNLRWIAVGALLVTGAAACSSDDDGSDAAPTAPATQRAARAPDPTTTVADDTTVPDTTEPAATTTDAPTTTPAPTTTAAPASRNVGVVWSSAVDPARNNQPPETQPRWESDGVTVQLDMLISIDPTETGDLAAECRQAIDIAVETIGGAEETECLLAQWTFNVSPDLTRDAYVTAEALLNTDGQQVDAVGSGFGDGVPGARGRVMNAYYAGGQPGATIRFRVSGADGGIGTEHILTVPPREAMIPLTFD